MTNSNVIMQLESDYLNATQQKLLPLSYHAEDTAWGSKTEITKTLHIPKSSLLK